MAEMFRAAPPELVIVTCKAGDELPTVTLPKSWLAGATEMFGTGDATPFPDSETFTVGVSGSFEVIVRVATSVPVDVGLNVTVAVQLLPATTVGVGIPHGLPPPLRFKE